MLFDLKPFPTYHQWVHRRVHSLAFECLRHKLIKASEEDTEVQTSSHREINQGFSRKTLRIYDRYLRSLHIPVLRILDRYGTEYSFFGVNTIRATRTWCIWAHAFWGMFAKSCIQFIKTSNVTNSVENSVQQSSPCGTRCVRRATSSANTYVGYGWEQLYNLLTIGGNK